MTRFGEGGGDQARHPEPVAVIASGLVGGNVDIGRNVVWGDSCGRWHVIVKAPAFVPDNDEQHVLPLRACRSRLEDAGGECFPYLVVLKFSFGGSNEFGRDQAYGGQLSVLAVVVEVGDVVEVVVPAQKVPRPQAHFRDVCEVVGPADVMGVEQVPDQPGQRGMREWARDGRADQAGGGGGLKKSPVRERLRQAGGEVAVPDAVGASEAVIPGQIGSVQVSHGIVAAGGGG